MFFTVLQAMDRRYTLVINIEVVYLLYTSVPSVTLITEDGSQPSFFLIIATQLFFS